MTTAEVIPDDETADMQREEVHALEAIFDSVLELSSRRDGDECFEFPIVYRIKLNDMYVDADNVDTGSCSDDTTNWPKRPLVVEIRYPKNYPSDDNDDDLATTVPSFELLHENTVVEFPSSASKTLLTILRETARNERGMPSVLSCLYAARDFLDGDREWQDASKSKSAENHLHNEQQKSTIDTPAIPKSDMKYACISTHHLFDHKPDNLLKTGHKCHLSGFYKFGTPGIAVAWGDTENIEDFVDTLKRAMPQKKFEILFLRSWCDGNEQEDQIPLGWTSVDPPALKEELAKIGVPEEDYYTALGIEQSNDKNGKSKGKGKSKNK
jgi:hypothetical protein